MATIPELFETIKDELIRKLTFSNTIGINLFGTIAKRVKTQLEINNIDINSEEGQDYGIALQGAFNQIQYRNLINNDLINMLNQVVPLTIAVLGDFDSFELDLPISHFISKDQLISNLYLNSPKTIDDVEEDDLYDLYTLMYLGFTVRDIFEFNMLCILTEYGNPRADEFNNSDDLNDEEYY